MFIVSLNLIIFELKNNKFSINKRCFNYYDISTAYESTEMSYRAWRSIRKLRKQKMQ